MLLSGISQMLGAGSIEIMPIKKLRNKYKVERQLLKFETEGVQHYRDILAKVLDRGTFIKAIFELLVSFRWKGPGILSSQKAYDDRRKEAYELEHDVIMSLENEIPSDSTVRASVENILSHVSFWDFNAGFINRLGDIIENPNLTSVFVPPEQLIPNHRVIKKQVMLWKGKYEEMEKERDKLRVVNQDLSLENRVLREELDKKKHLQSKIIDLEKTNKYLINENERLEIQNNDTNTKYIYLKEEHTETKRLKDLYDQRASEFVDNFELEKNAKIKFQKTAELKENDIIKLTIELQKLTNAVEAEKLGSENWEKAHEDQLKIASDLNLMLKKYESELESSETKNGILLKDIEKESKALDVQTTDNTKLVTDNHQLTLSKEQFERFYKKLTIEVKELTGTRDSLQIEKADLLKERLDLELVIIQHLGPEAAEQLGIKIGELSLSANNSPDKGKGVSVPKIDIQKTNSDPTNSKSEYNKDRLSLNAGKALFFLNHSPRKHSPRKKTLYIDEFETDDFALGEFDSEGLPSNTNTDDESYSQNNTPRDDQDNLIPDDYSIVAAAN